jgi:hypothetical protein
VAQEIDPTLLRDLAAAGREIDEFDEEELMRMLGLPKSMKSRLRIFVPTKQ